MPLTLPIEGKFPDQHVVPSCLWEREAVRDLIVMRYEIVLAIRSIGDYLTRWGFTPERPVQRAYEQDRHRRGSHHRLPRWQSLTLRPLPHGHGSFRGVLAKMLMISAGRRCWRSKSTISRIEPPTWWKKSLYPAQR